MMKKSSKKANTVLDDEMEGFGLHDDQDTMRTTKEYPDMILCFVVAALVIAYILIITLFAVYSELARKNSDSTVIVPLIFLVD